MKILTCELPGLLIIEPKVFGDQRGYFMETWNQRRYADSGLDLPFVQDNASFSQRGVLRGLHFQNPSVQGKLVFVLHGEVFDVAVDLRRNSGTFGQWRGVHLSEGNKRQFYIPPGFAHGFQALSDLALFYYKCTEFYSPKNELTIRWDDPELAIDWPIKPPVVSQKDGQALFLRDLPPGQLFE